MPRDILAPQLQASDPVRFRPAMRGGSADPASDEALRRVISDGNPSILEVLEAHMETLRRALDELNRRQRLRFDTVWCEHFYAAAEAQTYAQETTNDIVRITYVFGYIGGGKTGSLNLRGGLSNTSFSLPIGANTQPPLALCLGDGETGGLILRPQDLRSISTSDGSSQQIIGLLLGERLRDSYQT